VVETDFIGNPLAQDLSARTIQLMKDLSNEFIFEAQHIPVYWEQAMRIQQENQNKRIKKYYYFALDQDIYDVDAEAIYFNNGQRFTVFQDLSRQDQNSSSSSESYGNTSSSSSSSFDSRIMCAQHLC